MVFACYLFDREVIGDAYLADLGMEDCAHLRDVLSIRPAGSAKAALYRLFRRLGKDFNGDLFSDDLDEEERLVSETDVWTLCEFFHGTDVRTHQGRFWPYDFGYIPVETVSAIYERFLDGDGQREGAFYTPRFLATMVLDTALEGERKLIGKRFLDPACGSGIFLVGLFNRLAWEWTQSDPQAPNDRRAEALLGLLRESVYGVEKSRVACRIAAFSLYLAYLDQLSPRDIQGLQRNGPALPRLVDEPGRGAPGPGERLGNIVCADFFAVDSRPYGNFDFVVGNPPWGRVGKKRARGTMVCGWREGHARPADRDGIRLEGGGACASGCARLLRAAARHAVQSREEGTGFPASVVCGASGGAHPEPDRSEVLPVSGCHPSGDRREIPEWSARSGKGRGRVLGAEGELGDDEGRRRVGGASGPDGARRRRCAQRSGNPGRRRRSGTGISGPRGGTGGCWTGWRRSRACATTSGA